MSHFTVLVIGKDVEEKLAPFQENNMNDCPKEYLKFKIRDKNWKIHYFDNEEDFKNSWIEIEDWEEWYYENPNAKWDWYLIGWRWSWMLKLKDWKIWEKWQRPLIMWWWVVESWYDQAKVWDVDWEWMKKEEYDKFLNKYNKVKNLFGWTIPKITRSEKSFIEEFWKDIGHEKFINQDEIKDYIRVLTESFWKKDNPFSFREKLENFQFVNAEEYAEYNSKNFFTTYAVIDEKWKWYSSWDMWWFACSSETDEEKKEFNDNYFEKFLKNLSPETLITVVDCHI